MHLADYTYPSLFDHFIDIHNDSTRHHEFQPYKDYLLSLPDMIKIDIKHASLWKCCSLDKPMDFLGSCKVKYSDGESWHTQLFYYPTIWRRTFVYSSTKTFEVKDVYAPYDLVNRSISVHANMTPAHFYVIDGLVSVMNGML